VGALSPHREGTAVAQPPVGPQIHEAFDIHGDIPPQVSFNLQVAPIDGLADLGHLGVGEDIRLLPQVHLGHLENFPGRGPSDSMDVVDNLDVLIFGKVDSAIRATPTSLRKIQNSKIFPDS
jgi:hypothetical protein